MTLADLFGDHDTLVVYSYMFGPQREAPCPMCTSLMGGFDHKIADIRQRVAIAFTARSPIERLVEAKQAAGLERPARVQRRERRLHAGLRVRRGRATCRRTTCSHGGTATIRHFWSEEIGGDMADPGQDPRGAVEMDPLWLLLDTTPEGRGTDWHPQLSY